MIFYYICRYGGKRHLYLNDCIGLQCDKIIIY